MRSHDYRVYILTNKHFITLYIGITNNLTRRLSQHRYAETEGFAKRYRLNRLVWLEHFRSVNDSIAGEKKLKGWRRSRKVSLIEQRTRDGSIAARTGSSGQRSMIAKSGTEEMIRDSSLRSE
jgi:putative endonuclease